jgi:hypothetical protein
MRKCAACCGIGKWWKTQYGSGPLLREVLDQCAREYLGVPL